MRKEVKEAQVHHKVTEKIVLYLDYFFLGRMGKRKKENY